MSETPDEKFQRVHKMLEDDHRRNVQTAVMKGVVGLGFGSLIGATYMANTHQHRRLPITLASVTILGYLGLTAIAGSWIAYLTIVNEPMGAYDYLDMEDRRSRGY